MRISLSLALLVVTLAMAGMSLLRVPSASAITCSMLGEPDPRARLDAQLDYAALVLVGQVTEEKPFDVLPGSYASTIAVAAVLKGDLPENPLTLGHLNDNWVCAGGPRLREGTAVLLLLHQSPIGSRSDGVPILIWETGPLGGNIFLGVNGAVMGDYYRHNRDPYLGENEDVVRHVAREAGASEADTARAIAAIGGNATAADDDDGLGWPFIVSVLVALGALVAGGTAYIKARRSRLTFGND
jgi:hypothetical protein